MSDLAPTVKVNTTGFRSWIKEYTDKDNFQTFDDTLMANMLLLSLWTHRQEKIDKLTKQLGIAMEMIEHVDCKDPSGRQTCEDGGRYCAKCEILKLEESS